MSETLSTNCICSDSQPASLSLCLYHFYHQAATLTIVCQYRHRHFLIGLATSPNSVFYYPPDLSVDPHQPSQCVSGVYFGVKKISGREFIQTGDCQCYLQLYWLGLATESIIWTNYDLVAITCLGVAFLKCHSFCKRKWIQTWDRSKKGHLVPGRHSSKGIYINIRIPLILFCLSWANGFFFPYFPFLSFFFKLNFEG